MSTPTTLTAYINTRKIFLFTLAEFTITRNYLWFFSNSNRDSLVKIIKKIFLLGRRFTAMMSSMAYFNSMLLIIVSSVLILVFPTISRSLQSAIIIIIFLFFLFVRNRNFSLFIMLIRDESFLLTVIQFYILIFSVFGGSSSVFQIIIITITSRFNIMVIILLGN